MIYNRNDVSFVLNYNSNLADIRCKTEGYIAYRLPTQQFYI
jgi:hypothetical protein